MCLVPVYIFKKLTESCGQRRILPDLPGIHPAEAAGFFLDFHIDSTHMPFNMGKNMFLLHLLQYFFNFYIIPLHRFDCRL